ncbi:MAG: hypothetical protein K2I93_01145, partial [Oscillospiraceae bacterium]|nr:hypothetical protein [Oscillospiraceae bacterium]
MSSFEQTERDFQKLERGTPRLNAMRDAIHEADRQQDLKWRFWFRYDYIEESVFCGDRYHAVIMFPELLALYDDSPELQEKVRPSMMVTFRWIVEAVQEFPQISKTEIDSYFRAFKRRLIEYGYSLHIYYHKRSKFYMYIDKAIAAADFYRFLEAPIDEISDGKELAYSHQVHYYLSIGDEEAAEKAAAPLLNVRLTSGNLPATLYDHFTDYYVYTTQEFDKAEKFARLTDPYIDGNPYNM